MNATRIAAKNLEKKNFLNIIQLETLMITPNQKPYLETLFENLNQKSLILENEKKK